MKRDSIAIRGSNITGKKHKPSWFAKRKRVIDKEGMILSLKEAAKLINIHQDTLRRWMDNPHKNKSNYIYYDQKI